MNTFVSSLRVLTFTLLALFLVITAALPVVTNAEDTELGYGFTKTIDESVYQIDVDSNGNSYQVGGFSGTTDFDPGSGTDSHTAGGSNDIFITKFNADGTYGYTKTMGSTGSDYALNVAIDNDDNIYLAGNFSSTVDFDPGAGTDNKTAVGFSDLFLTKFNADGTYGYTKTIGGATGDFYQYSIATDQTGSVYISGAFGGTADFDPSIDVDEISSVEDYYDVYLTKINADGSYVYTKTIHGPADEASHPIATDSNNNVYLAGYFYDATVDFDPSVGTDEHTTFETAAFLTKLTSDGDYVYTKTFDSEFNGLFSTVVGESVKTDQENNVYLAGYFYDATVDFDPGAGTDEHTAVGSSDVFITKLSSDGSYVYTKTIGDGDNIVQVGYVDTDTNNNVYLAGRFRYSNEGGSSSVDFDPGPTNDSRASSVYEDGFLTRINADGTYGYTTIIGGTSNDYISSLAVDQMSNVYLSGRFDGTVDFDPTAGTDNKTATGDGGFAFLTKLTQATYQQITGLPPSLVAKTLTDLDATDNTIEQGDTVIIRLYNSDNLPIADIDTTFDSDLDWSTITADIDPVSGKAFAHNLASAEGTASSFTLYVPKITGDDRVGICPGAASLAAVTDECEGLYYLTEGEDDNLSTVRIDGQDYWAISGLTGTGGFSASEAGSTNTLADTGSELANVYVSVMALFLTGSVVWLRRKTAG